MKVQFKAFVRDVYVADKDKAGVQKAHPVHYITFLDLETGGDVKLSAEPGHGFVVGQTVDVNAVVKGRAFGQAIGYHVEHFVKSK